MMSVEESLTVRAQQRELVQIQATFFAITCLRCSTYLQLK